MKKLIRDILPIGVLLLVMVSSVCAGSWLHRSYQGSFCDNGFKYNVDTDGTVRIEKLPPPCPNPCQVNSGSLVTYYGSTYPNSIYVTYDDLPNLIKNLTKIQADMKAADNEK